MTVARFMRNPYSAIDPEASELHCASFLAAAQAFTRAQRALEESPPDAEPDVEPGDDLDDRKSEDDPDDRKSEEESADEDPPVAAEAAANMVNLHPHALVLSAALYGDDNSLGWNCDGRSCDSVDQKGPRMHCAACQFDVCLTCWYAAPPDDVRQQDDADALENDGHGQDRHQDIDADEFEDDGLDEFGGFYQDEDGGFYEDEYGDCDDF
jgi:hypothetical protein